MAKDTKAIIDKIVDLPTLPQVVTTLMSLLDNPRSSVKDINNVMGKDPTLVAKLLKLVNSAFYAIPQRVNSIPQAISILGFKTIKSLAISASVLGLFDSDNEEFSYQEFWAHSLGVATICRFIVMKTCGQSNSGCFGVQPDSAFVGGLLHGLGKIIIDQYDNEDFVKIIARAKKENLSFRDAEKGILDTSYTEIGYWLVRKWKLSDDVQHMIKYQNNIVECPKEHQGVASALVLSNYLCRVKKYGHNGDYDKPQPPREVLNILSFSKEIIAQISEGFASELANAEAFISMIRT